MTSDCGNAEVRDLLPDLVNGSMRAGDRAAVEAHVAACAACAAELALLRAARSALHAAPAVDVQRIVRSLPAPPRRRGMPEASGRRWLRAAAVALLVGGAGGAYVLGRGAGDEGGRGVPLAGVQETGVDAAERAATAAAVQGAETRADGATLLLAAGLRELDEESLAALLAELDSLGSDELMPSAEPGEPVPALIEQEGV